jgi:hypothetical protein
MINCTGSVKVTVQLTILNKERLDEKWNSWEIIGAKAKRGSRPGKNLGEVF